MVQRRVWSMKPSIQRQYNHRFIHDNIEYMADLAQLVKRKALNLVVMGSSPMVGVV